MLTPLVSSPRLLSSLRPSLVPVVRCWYTGSRIKAFIRAQRTLLLSHTIGCRSLSSASTSVNDTLGNSSNLRLIDDPIEREPPLQYHGRIVATPQPDFAKIQTESPTNATDTSSNYYRYVTTVLLPKNRKHSRSTEKEIDPISIYGTTEIPSDRRNARMGPVYYQPHQPHFDWCTNTMNQISSTSPLTTTTTTSEPSLFDAIRDDLPASHVLSPIPLLPPHRMTQNQKPDFDFYNHLPSTTTKLYLYLYRPQAQAQPPTTATTNTTPTLPKKNVQLDFELQSSEYVMETLQRISLKLIQQQQSTTTTDNSTKIYYSGNRRKQLEISKQILLKKQATAPTATTWDEESQSSASSCISTQYNASVWYLTDPNTTSTNINTESTVVPGSTPQAKLPIKMKKINVTNYTNQDLWKLGLQTPLAVIFTLQRHPETDDNLSQHGQQNGPPEEVPSGAEALPKELCFLLETFPPTIYSVTTFDYWGSYLYVGMPIKIQVETMYATNTRVDWYIDGMYYQSTYDNTHAYTPLMSHLHKKVTILITPYREYDTTSTDDDDDDDKNHNRYKNHTGIGCEKAYRFHRLVEVVPINTILDVRNNWLSKSRNQRLLDRQKNETNRNSASQDSDSTSTCDAKPERRLRVMTYNILADCNAYQVKNQVTMYPYVKKNIMEKARRMPLILHEILSYQADVICLQEVDYPVFETLLLPILQQYGYQGYYSGKHGENTNEGCAMFWSIHTFAPVSEQDQQAILLRDLVVQGNVDGTNVESTRVEWSTVNHDIWSLLFRRPDLNMALSAKLPHVAQMVPLYFNSDQKGHSPRPIWVANTHLYYHPQASHIRLLQMLLLLRHAHANIKTNPGEFFLCGDLNSSSQTSTGKLILDRTIPANYRTSKKHLNTFRDRSLAPSEEVFRSLDDNFPSFTLPHSFPKLVSAIDPPVQFTHCTHEFCGTLDHILFTPSDKDRIQLISSAPMPLIEDVTVATAMPSPNIPSDHVSLICDFKVNDYKG